MNLAGRDDVRARRGDEDRLSARAERLGSDRQRRDVGLGVDAGDRYPVERVRLVEIIGVARRPVVAGGEDQDRAFAAAALADRVDIGLFVIGMGEEIVDERLD